MPFPRVFRVLALFFPVLATTFSSGSAMSGGLPGRQAGSGQASGAPMFPTLAAEALDRTLLTLPRQFEGARNLVFLFWARDQVGEIDTWNVTAQLLQHAASDFRVYRMPVGARENALYRWWDNNSLRTAETDPELLHWTVPLYTDKAALQQSLDLGSDERSIAVLLLDRAGHVLWKGRGPSTEAGRAGLLAAAQNKH